MILTNNLNLCRSRAHRQRRTHGLQYSLTPFIYFFWGGGWLFWGGFFFFFFFFFFRGGGDFFWGGIFFWGGGIFFLQYNTVQYSTVQSSTVQYSTVQYSTVQYNTVQYSTIQYNTVQYSTIQYSTQYSTVQSHPTPKVGGVEKDMKEKEKKKSIWRSMVPPPGTVGKKSICWPMLPQGAWVRSPGRKVGDFVDFLIWVIISGWDCSLSLSCRMSIAFLTYFLYFLTNLYKNFFLETYYIFGKYSVSNVRRFHIYGYVFTFMVSFVTFQTKTFPF